ncbi:MAG: hypothetical protein ACERKV_09705 [Clostridiaceae bacterium]
MFCKSVKNSEFWIALVVIGVISLVFGIISNGMIPDGSNNLNMLMGMFTGLGASFTAIGTFKLIHIKRASAAKLKQEEIDLKDERNIQVLRISYTVASATASVLFSIMIFLFVFLNYITASFICLGALYIQILAFFISYKYFSKKM